MKTPLLTFKSGLRATAFLALMIAVGLAWSNYQSALKSPAVIGNPVVIEINKGDSFNQITQKLLDAKLVIQPLWFRLLAIQQQAFKHLKAGEYELANGLTMPEILLLFVLGKTKHYSLTIPEGWNFKQLSKALADNPKLDYTFFINPNNKELMKLLGSQITHPEGLFFPDTYFYEKHTPALALLKRAYRKMQTVVEQEWRLKAPKLPFKTPYEALILASIVEKETAVAEERPMIAGVFIRRMQQGMPLQTDPTVIYGMGEGFQGDIHHRDLTTATPYNTYVIKGLPPTPIAMPGRAALNAVLHPDHSDNLYFVAKGDGSHVFSATLKEHHKAVATYQTKPHGTR